MAKSLQTALIITLGLVSLGLGLWFFDQTTAQKPATGYAKLGGDFTLDSHAGPVSLNDFRGKLVAIYFGYTHCPDICPTTLIALSQALKQLPADAAAQVQGIFISVDPERDDLKRLGEYVAYFHPNIVGVTGDLQQIRDITKRYGAFFQKVDMGESSMGYAVDHSSTVYILDRNGIIQDFVRHSDTPEAILAALQKNL